jgi:hypothetical protein
MWSLKVQYILSCLALALIFTASAALGQNCSTYAIVDVFDGKTSHGIDNLKTENFEARAGNLSLPIVSAKQDFNGRVLVLLQIDSSPEQRRMQADTEAMVDTIRRAPPGRPVAFGVFAEKTFISREFVADRQKRDAMVDGVLAQAAQLQGKTSAVYDTLHEALAAFGPHERGDTILLMSDGVDYSSKRNPADLQKEFLASGTRLLVLIEPDVRPTVANTLSGFHRKVAAPGLKQVSSATGGAFVYHESSNILDFAWAGYMLEIQVPATWDKPKEWQLRLKDSSGKIDKKALLYVPWKIAPCSSFSSSRTP